MVQDIGPEGEGHSNLETIRSQVKAGEHYGRYQFLLGDRASLGDFTFAGLFKAHIAADPEPRSWIDGSIPFSNNKNNNNNRTAPTQSKTMGRSLYVTSSWRATLTVMIQRRANGRRS